MTIMFDSQMSSRKRNGCKLAALEPVHGGSVNSNGLFSTDVRTILQITVLPLLLGLEIET